MKVNLLNLMLVSKRYQAWILKSDRYREVVNNLIKDRYYMEYGNLTNIAKYSSGEAREVLCRKFLSIGNLSDRYDVIDNLSHDDICANTRDIIVYDNHRVLQHVIEWIDREVVNELVKEDKIRNSRVFEILYRKGYINFDQLDVIHTTSYLFNMMDESIVHTVIDKLVTVYDAMNEGNNLLTKLCIKSIRSGNDEMSVKLINIIPNIVMYHSLILHSAIVVRNSMICRHVLIKSRDPWTLIGNVYLMCRDTCDVNYMFNMIAETKKIDGHDVDIKDIFYVQYYDHHNVLVNKLIEDVYGGSDK